MSETLRVRATALDLLVRYVRSGSSAAAFVAADAFRELGLEDLGDDVEFSGQHCRKGRDRFFDRVLAELNGGTVIHRGELPPLTEHFSNGYAPPSRLVVAIQHPQGDVRVWERVGFVTGPRRRFACEWREWGFYDRGDYRTDAQVVDATRLELELASLGEDTLLIRLDPWLRRLSDDSIYERLQILGHRTAYVRRATRDQRRADEWYDRFYDEGRRRRIV